MLSKSLESKIIDKSVSLLLLRYFVILQSVLVYNHSMSTKKQISSLCKLYSIYKEIPEEFLDETDVDSYFYQNLLDISQSHHRIVFELAKDPTKSLLPSKCFVSAIQSYSSNLFSRKKSAFLKRNMSFYSTVWVNFSKPFILPTKYRRFHYPNQNLRLDLQKQKMNSSLTAKRI